MIGIFDSGLGGLTVARALRRVLPAHDLIYFGDTARAPYGIKSPGRVVADTLRGIRFLRQRGARCLVIASHTASAVARDRIAAHSRLPVFDAVSASMTAAVGASKSGRIGVIGTPTAIESGIYQETAAGRQDGTVIHVRACPLLAPLVEAGWTHRPETAMIVKKCVHPLKVRQVDTLVLGSGRYLPLKKTMGRKMGKTVTLIDDAASLSHAVAAGVNTVATGGSQRAENASMTLWVSDRSRQTIANASLFWGRNIEVREAPSL